MFKKLISILLASWIIPCTYAQTTLSPLTVDKIMRDPIWIGTSPSALQWSKNSDKIFFQWNPDKREGDSLYTFSLSDSSIHKTDLKERKQTLLDGELVYNHDRSKWTYSRNGNVYYQSNDMTNPIAVMLTQDGESNPVFSFDETAVVYSKSDNLYAWNISDGTTNQLTNFFRGSASTNQPKPNIQESWLRNDQLKEFGVLADRKHKKDIAESITKNANLYLTDQNLKPIYLDDKMINNLQISPDGNYIYYRLSKFSGGRNAQVPAYVTESGFTELLPARSKVGVQDGAQELWIYNRIKDTSYQIDIKSLEGIQNIPLFYNDYPSLLIKKQKDSSYKSVSFYRIKFSAKSIGVVDVYSNDNKDRWICSIHPENGKLDLIDHQHDEAWIGGPGIGFTGNQGWIDDDQYWFQSEVSGYSHIYIHSVSAHATKQLTAGNYEIQDALLSKDHKRFYISTNQVHPGELQFYHLDIASGRQTRITMQTGANQVILSPDEKYIAFRFSYSNKPWEMYLQENKPGSAAMQITHLAMSEEFKSYPWRDPEVLTLPAKDGARVYARLYQPNKKLKNKAAVLFVHGAGYLQNAHKWWSQYFREYFFNNLLADQGYTVLDIDYRGSAHYGRDWRTGIYRFMGGKDLEDHVDAANYLVSNLGIDKNKIGIYGGSYGGFMSLMALFTKPDVFAAGAALRPVTDWANYNHGYTSNILNEPFTDSIAYHRSSPFYFAGGLTKPLLICHGMVDVNVHYQDAVKLAQRLIELKKENWELASYPMEDHGFVEPSSWTDEYKRILKLFNQNLK